MSGLLYDSDDINTSDEIVAEMDLNGVHPGVQVDDTKDEDKWSLSFCSWKENKKLVFYDSDCCFDRLYFPDAWVSVDWDFDRPFQIPPL